MQETPAVQARATDAAEEGMREYLSVAEMQAEILQKILRSLQNGTDLSLAAWSEGFEASQHTLEHIQKALTLAQEVFDGHEVQMSGALSEEMTCDEFQCLTWK
jgi:SHS2 domain-containing protein